MSDFDHPGYGPDHGSAAGPGRGGPLGTAMHAAMGGDEWFRLVGTGARARERGVRIRRVRRTAVTGAAVAVLAGAVAAAGPLTRGGTPLRGAAAGPATGSAPTAPAPSPTRTPSGSTLGDYFKQWAACPADQLTVGNTAAGDPPDLQERIRAKCERDIAALTVLFPGSDISPAAGAIGVADGGARPTALMGPGRLDPSTPVPPGATPHMAWDEYRVAKGGKVFEISIQAWSLYQAPPSGVSVTPPPGFVKARLLAVPAGHQAAEFWAEDAGKHVIEVFVTGPDAAGVDLAALTASPAMATLLEQDGAGPTIYPANVPNTPTAGR